MKRQDNALTGEPVTDEEQAFYTDWAERIEDDDYESTEGARVEIADPSQSVDTLLDELETAARPGRPALSGHAGGESPKRQVRLPHDLDAALQAFAAAENRRPSAIMRDALAEYLNKKAS